MPSDSPSPEPAVTPGLEPGGGVRPGDTPPTADQMSGAAYDRDAVPNQGPISGNRTPMVIALVLVALLVLMVLVYVIAQIATYGDGDTESARSLAGLVTTALD